MEYQMKLLRSFHNKVKLGLIQKYCKNTDSILDVGVGRGGDIMKWYNNKIKNAVGLDVEHAYVREAIRRYNHFKIKNDTNYKFYVINPNDTFVNTLKKRNMPTKYDNVSCQFCLHYFASSEECLSEFLSMVSNCLNPGGHFVGTVPNGDDIVSLLDGNEEYSDDILFVKKNPDRHGAIQFSMTGTLYFGENMVSHEYLVHEDVLRNVAERHNLELIEWTSFGILTDIIPQDMDENTRRTSFLNNVFVFRRV